MNTTLENKPSLAVRYVLRAGDTCLILAQRLCEWSGHAPMLEEDIALSNMALDLVGQARALYTHAGALEGAGRDEDQIAFLRIEAEYFNPTLVELPRGDFAFTVVRNLMVASYLKGLWQHLGHSTDAELAAIAGKALKEARYHQQHAADWLVRLGDGTAESKARCEAALRKAWPYAAELFEADEVDAAAQASGLGPACSGLREAWEADMAAVLQAASLVAPKTGAFRSTGKRGVHSEHMGFLLAEMQHLQRAFPGGVW
jgi:ring-1,2-phenylacetyl-CoA epoxidase subunit PaaC